MMKIKYILFLIVLLGIVGWGPFSFFFPTNNEPPGSQAWIAEETRAIDSQASNLDPSVLKLSLGAYLRARQKGLDHKELLTIIDYSKPSSERRLWVIDIKKEKVLFNTWVSHGKNSGEVSSTSFSNEEGSLKSSIGVFVTTDQPYVGSNGYSLRMMGLEHGINDNAYRRNIVFHGAPYVNSDFAKKYGEVGHSWGCPAVSEDTARPLINTIKDQTLVVAYYPNWYWLRNSMYLAG